MKKVAIFLMAVITAILFCACGGSKFDGTWYAIEDSTMYKFEDGEVTSGGQTVGQYEDKGDSIVLSMADNDDNLVLYLTTTEGGTECLADSDEEGMAGIYFCKGLENVDKVNEEADKAKAQQAKEETDKLFELRDKYAKYINENIIGTWMADDPDDPVTKIVFSGDFSKMTKTWGDGRVETLYIIESESYFGIEDDVPTLNLLVSSEKNNSEDAGWMFANYTDETFTKDKVKFYNAIYTKVK